MSGLEIFGLIASLGGITGAIIETYGAIRDLHGLPEAFNEVNNRLPLVQSTLDSIKGQADRLRSPDEKAAVARLLGNCIKKAEELLSIFEKVSRKSGKRFAVSAYRSIATKLGRKHRVEMLMDDILRDLQVLMAHRAFQTVPQAQSDELAGARDSLAQTCLDQPDSGGDGNPGSGADSNSESGADSNSESGADSNSGSGADSNPRSGADSNPRSGSAGNLRSGSASQTGPQSRQYNSFGGPQKFINGYSFESNGNQYFGRVPARNVNSPSDPFVDGASLDGRGRAGRGRAGRGNER